MTMKMRLTNIVFIDGGFTADAEWADKPDAPPPPVVETLPEGYSTDTGVGYQMLVQAMDAAGLTPIGVQGKGAQIVAALKRSYPALDVYLSAQDAPVWPGFGSLDVTIDSGKGGWSFRVDHVTAWQPVGAR